MKYFLEQDKLDKKWVENYCHGNWKKCIRYQKEENGIFHPDNMLPDGTVDKNL
ncbi:MAG: uracil-DNA glycosylase [Candidatus Cloacimonetes bacterium]|nr:uracil-DNA glycosylase [Candidatus Cloacimonadota bacterium]